MPDVVGLPLDATCSALVRFGFRDVRVVHGDPPFPGTADDVWTVDPAPGEPVTTDETVTLTIGSGPDACP